MSRVMTAVQPIGTGDGAVFHDCHIEFTSDHDVFTEDMMRSSNVSLSMVMSLRARTGRKAD